MSVNPAAILGGSGWAVTRVNHDGSGLNLKAQVSVQGANQCSVVTPNTACASGGLQITFDGTIQSTIGGEGSTTTDQVVVCCTPA